MSYKATKRDQMVADDVLETDRQLRCSAHGCPRLWSVSGDRGKACSAHYWAEPADWPRITADLQRQETERAFAVSQAKPAAATMNREQRRALLQRLSEVGRTQADPKAWAKRLRDRHKAGETLTRAQIDAYRRALPYDDWTEGGEVPV
jgi:hypothetical protein